MGWIALYAALVGLPVVVMALWPGAAAGRPWLMQVGVGCGFVAFAVFVLEFALIAKIRPMAAAFGMDGLVRVHRKMGILAAWLVTGHAGALLWNGYPLEWVYPWGEFASWEMRWGVVAVAALVVLLVSTLWRKELGIGYARWEWIHNIAAKILVAAALAHVWMFGGYSSEMPMRILLVAYGVGLVGVSIYFEVWKPVRMWMKPWEVVENRVESADTRTLVLKPVGHEGFRFSPGQFAWLSTEMTPFGKDRHPVSMSNAPGEATVAFTVKALGDWSGTEVPRIPQGSLMWVDGPYGVFTPDRVEAPGLVLIGGGVGVTPLVSMCEAMAARGDQREVVFFYGSQSVESLRFRERLGELEKHSRLKMVYALEAPPEGWSGEKGFVTAEMLRRHLPERYADFAYFVCGPEAMMDAVEGMLKELGVPGRQVHTERFVMV